MRKREAALAELRGKIARTAKTLEDTDRPRRRCSRGARNETSGAIEGKPGRPSWRAALLAACATPPKPPELGAYEALRKNSRPSSGGLQAFAGSGGGIRKGRAREGPRRVGIERSRGVAPQRPDGANQAQDRAGPLRAGSAQGAYPTLSDEQARRWRTPMGWPRIWPANRRSWPCCRSSRNAQDRQGRQGAAVAADVDRAGEGASRAAAPVADGDGQKIAAAQLALRPPTPSRPAITPRRSTTPPVTCSPRPRPRSNRATSPGAQASAEVAKKNADHAAEVAKPALRAGRTVAPQHRGATRRWFARPPRSPAPPCGSSARGSAAAGHRRCTRSSANGATSRPDKRPSSTPSPHSSRSTRVIRCRSSGTRTPGEVRGAARDLGGPRPGGLFRARLARCRGQAIDGQRPRRDGPRFDNKIAPPPRQERPPPRIVFLYH